MRKLGFVALSTLALASVSGVSHAQENSFGKGTFAIGAERMSGFLHAKQTVTQNIGGGTRDVSTSGDRFMLMGMSPSGPYDLPRIGLDYFIIDHLSLGGTLYVGYSSAEATFGGLNGGASETDILFAPRVGYAVMFNDTIGVWPRGGFGYFHASVNPDNGPDQSAHYFNLNLDCPFLFAVHDQFAITVGPLIDVSFAGSHSVQQGGVEVSQDISYTSFGLLAGLVGWL